MPKISVLPKEVAELIAAGEVVEKPASVIKEITENSIDAGATSITVEIRHGGIFYMRVTDNGCGIRYEDVPTAFLRHATSKIVRESDLDHIATLGFRGEALAAISSVSKVELLTCTETEEAGTRYVIEGGEQKAYGETGCPIGTTIIVRDLFYNTPARMKFLRKDVFEGNLIAELLEKMALSHPEIAFQFIRDGKTVFNTAGDGKLESAIYKVLGREFSSSLIPVFDENGHITVSGYICKPVCCRPKRNAQYFFINGRLVRSATAVAALEAAYKNSAMVGKFPACVLHIGVPADTVDVNVHPAKTEVRFSAEKIVFDAIFFAVKNALNRGDTRPEISVKKPLKFSAFEHLTAEEYRQAVMTQPKDEKKTQSVIAPEKPSENPVGYMRLHDYDPVEEQQYKKRNVDVFPEPDEITPAQFSARTAEEEPVKVSECKPIISDIRYVGEAFRTYIIVERGDSVFFIDKHAAHERILFEKLKKSEIPEVQQLLLPVTVKLDAVGYNAVLAGIDTLARGGFELEDFGNGSVLVRAVPAALGNEDVHSVMIELAANFAENASVSVERLDTIYHTVACKAAIKGGNITTPLELQKLAEEVLTRDDIMYCPHGRPVAFELKRHDLEKQFGRIQS